MTGSAEVGVIVQAINRMVDTLSDRIIKTETDVAEQITKFGEENRRHQQNVEGLLRQLVDLTKTVAVMQTEASHRDDKIDSLNKSILKTKQEHEETLKRIHERIDATDKLHKSLDDKVKGYFKIGSGMWLVLVAWFFIYQPVDVIKKANDAIRTLQEEVKDINAWRFEQIQQQRFRK